MRATTLDEALGATQALRGRNLPRIAAAGAGSSSHPQRTYVRTRKLSAFRDRGVPKPTSECRCVPQPRWVKRVGEREGGEARWPEPSVREVEVPRPSCSSRAQVGCACSRGLQASTRVREASGPKRAPVPVLVPARSTFSKRALVLPFIVVRSGSRCTTGV